MNGKKFKQKYGTKFYKFIRKDRTHRGYVYRLGLNVDTKPFYPFGTCTEGGLYFTDIRNIMEYYGYGSYIGIITLPDDSQVYVEKNKFKADKLVVSELLDNETSVLEVLKSSRENGCPWDEMLCAYAAQNGHLLVLRWARENGCPWDGRTCNFAARNGHLNVLQWARENDCPWDENTCNNAAENGHLNVLQWARENGCPWEKFTCSYAALNGHLNVLQWARENGCPWDESTCSFAALNGHLNVLRWARENGCPE